MHHDPPVNIAICDKTVLIIQGDMGGKHGRKDSASRLYTARWGVC